MSRPLAIIGTFDGAQRLLGLVDGRIQLRARVAWIFFARNSFCFSTIAATSESSFFASYTMPSLIVYLIPPTLSGRPVLSFNRAAPVPYRTFRFSSGF
jgi:hypothetical protein